MSDITKMTIEEIERVKTGLQEQQRKSQSDWAYWGWQGDIDKFEEAEKTIGKKQIELLIMQYGFNFVDTHIKNLIAVAMKQKELEEVQKKI